MTTETQSTDATPKDELAEKSTERLISHYKMARRDAANFNGHYSTDLTVRASTEARRVEDILDDRGVMSSDELRAMYEASDYSKPNWGDDE